MIPGRFYVGQGTKYHLHGSRRRERSAECVPQPFSTVVCRVCRWRNTHLTSQIPRWICIRDTLWSHERARVPQPLESPLQQRACLARRPGQHLSSSRSSDRVPVFTKGSHPAISAWVGGGRSRGWRRLVGWSSWTISLVSQSNEGERAAGRRYVSFGGSRVSGRTGLTNWYGLRRSCSSSTGGRQLLAQTSR